MRHFHANKWNWCKLQNFNFWINTLWFHCNSLKQALCFGSLTVKETKSLKNYQQSVCQFKTDHWVLINACTCKHLVPVGRSQWSMMPSGIKDFDLLLGRGDWTPQLCVLLLLLSFLPYLSPAWRRCPARTWNKIYTCHHKWCMPSPPKRTATACMMFQKNSYMYGTYH